MRSVDAEPGQERLGLRVGVRAARQRRQSLAGAVRTRSDLAALGQRRADRDLCRARRCRPPNQTRSIAGA